MVLTIEPMINTGTWEVDTDMNTGWAHKTLDGGLSCRYEHQFVITKDGPRIPNESGSRRDLLIGATVKKIIEKLQASQFVQNFLEYYKKVLKWILSSIAVAYYLILTIFPFLILLANLFPIFLLMLRNFCLS